MPGGQENLFKFMRVTASPDCNLRCAYCDPGHEFNPNMMSTPELLDTIQAGFELGIGVVHLTGGEPTVRKDIVELVSGIHQIGVQTIEMTTNGVLFQKNAERLALAGLTGVNISLDTFSRSTFRTITGLDALPLVLSSVEKAKALFGKHVSLNMVVMKTNFNEIKDFVEFSRQTGVLVRFCELTPHGPYMKNGPEFFDQNHIPKDQIITALEKIAPLEGFNEKPFDRQNAHSEYLALGGDYDHLTIGLIAPFSNGWPCPGSKCGRLRIGPTSANSCVIYPPRNLLGLSFADKKAVLNDLIQERKTQMESNQFPAQHFPEYLLYRFGLSEDQ